MGRKLGVVIVGVNGAVASTVIAGAKLMAKGLAPRVGMLTEKGNPAPGELITNFLEFTPIEDMVFGGWDLQYPNAYAAALHHQVLPATELEKVKADLEAVKPWPAVFSGEYAANVKGDNVAVAKTMREGIGMIEKNITDFKKQHGCDTVVMVNLASTEKYQE